MKSLFNKKYSLLFFLALFIFITQLGVLKTADADSRNVGWGGIGCSDNSGGTDCDGGPWSFAGDPNNYQAYGFESSARYQLWDPGLVGGSDMRYVVCLEQNYNVMYQGQCQGASSPSNYSIGVSHYGSTWYDLNTGGVDIGGDTTDYNYVVVTAHANDGVIEVGGSLKERRVSIDAFNGGNITVTAGQVFDITWGTSDTTEPPQFTWGGPIACDQVGIVANNSGSTCVAIQAGVAQLSIEVTGYNGNGGTITFNQNTNVTVNAAPVGYISPPAPTPATPYTSPSYPNPSYPNPAGCSADQYCAQYVSQTVSTNLITNQVVAATITMKNIGQHQWHADRYIDPWSTYLKSISGQNWGVTRVNEVSGALQYGIRSAWAIQGQNETHNFNITAPSTPGTYTWEWQMERGDDQDGWCAPWSCHLGYFGEKTPAVSILVTAPNSAPNAPGIGGPTTGITNIAYQHTFTATDSENDAIRYGIDWDNNSTVDEWIPSSGYTASGTQVSSAHSWTTNGVKTFKALAQDSPGLNSAWTTYTITISNIGTNGSCGTANKTYAYGSSSFGSDTLCAAGIESPAAPVFPGAGSSTNWICLGTGGGSNSGQCTATQSAAAGYTVTVTADSTIGGSVRSTDSLINTQTCGSPCVRTYGAATGITLQAYPSSTYWKFDHWSGDCSGNGLCALSVTSPKSVTATFVPRAFNYKEF